MVFPRQFDNIQPVNRKLRSVTSFAAVKITFAIIPPPSSHSLYSHYSPMTEVATSAVGLVAVKGSTGPPSGSVVVWSSMDLVKCLHNCTHTNSKSCTGMVYMEARRQLHISQIGVTSF